MLCKLIDLYRNGEITFLHQIMPIYNSLLWARVWSVQLICITGLSPHVFKNPRKKIQGQNFNQSRHMDYYRGGSTEQEENKQKTSSTGKVKD